MFTSEHAFAFMWWFLCIVFFMELSVCHPLFELGLSEIPSYLCSCSGCWHSSSDCWTYNVAVLLAVFVHFCDGIGISHGVWVCKKILAHLLMVCCWMVLCPVIGIVGFSQPARKADISWLFTILQLVKVHIYGFGGLSWRQHHMQWSCWFAQAWGAADAPLQLWCVVFALQVCCWCTAPLILLLPCMTWHFLWIVPRCVSCHYWGGCGVHGWEEMSPPLLHAFGLLKYEALLWTAKLISLAW